MYRDFKEISFCEVCGKKDLKEVLNLGLHPLCDDLIEVGESKICREYPIEILFCDFCKTAHQKYQVFKEFLFPDNYHYRARFTRDVVLGMKNLADKCCDLLDAKKSKFVLDIGCNDGTLLNFFRENDFLTVGIEPTGAHIDCENNGHIVYNNYLSEEIAKKILQNHGYPDLITFTNVFAHIDNLNEVLRALKILFNENTILVIENHYMGSVIEKNQFDTFYHEHPRTYSLSSFVQISKSLDASIIKNEFPSRYGGNIRVFISRKNYTNNNMIEDVEKETEFLSHFSNLKLNVDSWKSKKSREINKIIESHGKINAKAFPGRAAILIKLLNLNENHINQVFEKPGSLKINHYLPGTRIPIVSDQLLFEKENINSIILNLAWHIPSEIETYLVENNFKGKIIHIIDPEDFT